MSIITVGIDKDYVTLTDAYNDSLNGDVLIIDEGTYNENIYMDEKVVSLIGNTHYPENGNVIINGDIINGTLRIKYGNSNSINVIMEGISFGTTIAIETLIYFYRVVGIWSGLNIIFNKCIFNPLPCIPIGGNIFGTFYSDTQPTDYALNSITLKYCHCQMWNDYLSDTYFCNIPNRSIQKSILSNNPRSHLCSGEIVHTFNQPNYILLDRDFYGYGPKYGSFFTSFEPTHCFSGTVTISGVPASRELRFFRSDNDAYAGSTTSTGVDGSYYIETSFGGSYNVVCLHDFSSPEYNDLIISKCYPKKI